ncbi:MAG: Ig-like domain-containing protein [Actinomycetota bacterium]
MRPLARSLVAVPLAVLVLALVALPALADAPVAADDGYSTPEDQPLVVSAGQGVLANDTDPDGTPVAKLVDDAANGTLELHDDGSFSYTPATDFHGPDSFTYRAFDGVEGSAVASVTLTVDPVNDAPVAADDVATTDEDTASAPMAVLANDTDVDGDTLSIVSVGAAPNGTATDNGNGTVTYTPGPDFNGEDSFDYVVGDGNGGTDTGTVAVTIDPVNDPPVAVDDSAGTNQGVALVVPAPGVLGNDSDVDNALAGLHSHLDDPPTHGSLQFHPGGSYTYTPDAGFHGVDAFTYHATDPDLAESGTATVTITVTNQSPVAAADAYPGEGDPVFEEDTPLDVPAPGVLANDTDPESDPLTARIDSPAHGQVTLNDDGSFSYVPDQDFAGGDFFTYRASDGISESPRAAVSLTVSPVEDPPVAVDDEATTPEDTPVVVDVLANDTDPDASDTLSVDAPATSVSGGSVSIGVDGTVTFSPLQDFNGDAGFDYTVDDGHRGIDIAHVTVHVTPLDDAPVGASDPYTMTSTPYPATAVTGVLANDSDVDGPALHAILVSGPALGTLGIGGLHADGSFTYTPNANVCQRDDSFTYRVSDGTLQSPPVTVTLHVRLPRRSASITVTPSTTVIAFAGSVTVVAHLGAFSPGVRITIARTPYGGSPITLITHAPDAGGNVRFTASHLLKRNAFVATSAFDNCHLPATSTATLVRVRARVSGVLTRAYRTVNGVRLFHRGTDPLYRATVLPAHPGATLHWVWQRKAGATWRNYFTPTVSTEASATGFFLQGTAVGVTYRIRAIGPYSTTGTTLPDNLPGASRWIPFRITR